MNSKRQLSPQAGTSGKKARGTFNPRDEATKPIRNPPFKTNPQVQVENKTNESDSDSEARDKAYLESERQKEFDIEFELALDKDNIKKALAMATTKEQKERAERAAHYIEQVGRKLVIKHLTRTLLKARPLKACQALYNKFLRTLIYLQVKRNRKSVTDPKNRPKLNFWSSPRLQAAAKSAQNYTSQVGRTYSNKQYNIYLTSTPSSPPTQIQVARTNMDTNNNNKSAATKAAASGAAESAKANWTSGFLPHGSKSPPHPKPLPMP